jgi:hypothetical protein
MEIVSRRKAREKGLPQYNTGIPCLHGHMSPRNTRSCECLECARVRTKKAFDALPPEIKREREERSRRKKQENPEQAARMAKYSAEYWKKYNERLREYNKRYREANKERLILVAKRWQEKNRAARNAYRKKYAEDHPEKTKEWESKSQATSRRELRDSYVKSVLCVGSKILQHADIPQTLVDAKRAELKLKRLLNEETDQPG